MKFWNVEGILQNKISSIERTHYKYKKSSFKNYLPSIHHKISQIKNHLDKRILNLKKINYYKKITGFVLSFLRQ